MEFAILCFGMASIIAILIQITFILEKIQECLKEPSEKE